MIELKWQSSPPAGCPFPPSETLRGITFTGRSATYTYADTWYPSWADDDSLYTPYTDGNWDQPITDVQAMDCSSDGRNHVNAKRDGKSGTGNARIIGHDPLNLTLVNLGVQFAAPAPYGGRYPCGSLVHNGIWYYGTYTLDETDRGLNWDVLGPFVGFRISRDYGKSWEECPHTPEKPIFGESGKHGGKVKIGAPHFVDFGKNMVYSPDSKAYLVAHGAARADAEVAWIRGDQAYLLRAAPTPETMNQPAAWEFFGGHDAHGQPIWTKDFGAIKPLIEWDGRIGHATITYNAPLRKYLLFVTDGGNTISAFNTFVLEAESVTGPWKLVTFMEKFGEQAYFVNLPSKFISANGQSGWLCYSANFSNMGYGSKWVDNPPGSRYGMCLYEFRFDTSR